MSLYSGQHFFPKIQNCNKFSPSSTERYVISSVRSGNDYFNRQEVVKTIEVVIVIVVCNVKCWFHDLNAKFLLEKTSNNLLDEKHTLQEIMGLVLPSIFIVTDPFVIWKCRYFLKSD